MTSPGKALMTSYKRIFSPTLINELNVGFIDRPQFNQNFEGTLGAVQRDKVGFNVRQFNPAANPLNLLPEATFGGVTGAGQIGFDGPFPENSTQKIFNINDNITKTLGSHTIMGKRRRPEHGFFENRRASSLPRHVGLPLSSEPDFPER
jgi:hypothetical protein